MHRRRFAAVLLAFVLVVVACGSREPYVTAQAPPADDGAAADDGSTDGSDDGADDNTDSATEVDCSQETPEATEIGVTEDTITLVVMADDQTPLAPGLFRGAMDGALAWADKVNAAGGLACREIVMEEWDSLLNPLETSNGFLYGCDNALALVGTTVLFGTDTTDLNSCADQAGNATGLPDLAYITTEPPHQCSTTSVHVSRPGSECPYEEGPRTSVVNSGNIEWLQQNVEPDLHGAYIVANDLASTIGANTPQLAAHQDLGVVYDLVLGISGTATQGEMGQYMQPLRDAEANFVYNGSNDTTFINFMQEAKAQGVDMESITWMCTLSCYTPAFLELGGDAVEGAYVWTFYLPFWETETNDELAAFIDGMGSDFPSGYAAGAWADGVLFERIVDEIVAEDGINGLTRQAILDRYPLIRDYDVNGWWGPMDMSTTLNTANCFMMMQVQNGEFVRLHPEEPGELDCTIGSPVVVDTDPNDVQFDN